MTHLAGDHGKFRTCILYFLLLGPLMTSLMDSETDARTILVVYTGGTIGKLNTASK
jgi:L-asparaginase/Glu-tRNA(Gln) amidotransferase subunit D